ncbi:MAG: hypothetical protein IPG89_04350 [Bacteroidetes bacterium]|nr:hypothetical protein [Bacteroidota bacterium]
MKALSVMELRPHLKTFSLNLEKELHSLWDILAKIKTKKINEVSPEEMMNFQYRLVKVLNEFSRYYDILSNTRKSLEKHKKKIGFKEFLKQKKEVNELISFVNFQLVVCRSLGDAFVYTFYALDREYLNKHLEQQPQSLILPKGIGGLGEMEFVKNFKIIDGHLVLYHGITNILRIGDFTLFNIKTAKVAAVGELKSGKPDESSLNLNLTVIGPKSREMKFTKKDKTGEAEQQTTTFNFPNKERYEKQVKAMSDSFDYLTNKNPETPISEKDAKLFSKPKWDIMAELAAEPVDKIIAYHQVDRGLILSRFAYKGETMFDRFMNYTDTMAQHDKDELTEWFMKIFNREIDFSVAFGQVHFSPELRIQQAVGSKPLFWNSIKIDVLKKIYFGEIIFFTMYNVGYLFDEMKQRGYTLEDSVKHKMKGFTKKDTDMHYFVGGIPYYVDMITRYLQDESSVIQSIERVAAAGYPTVIGTGVGLKVQVNIFMD